MIKGSVVSIGMSKGAIYTLPSIQPESETIDLTFGGDDTTLIINKYAKGLTLDMLATNGVLFKIDKVLHCSTCTFKEKENL